MTNNFIVSQASMKDIEGLVYLFNEYRIFYKQDSDIEGARRFLLERFENNESSVFVVMDKENDRMIGFTQLYPSFSSVSMKRLWVLNDLYVNEDYRRQGVAQLLLDAAKTFAQQNNAKGLALQTALDNVKAQRLYERNGYERDVEFYSYFLQL